MFAIDLPQRADAFRRMHQPDAGRILVLPNAWDAMSARLIEDAGARAIATTSAGVAWSLGRTDGEGLTRDQMINAVERIARVRVPVTADVERGYGDGTPADVAETVRRVIGAGAVGINLEDGTGGPALVDAGEQAARIAAAREAASAEGVEIYVNARIDTYLAQVGAPEGRLDETVRRAKAYAGVGADGVFVPGVVDAETIRALVGAVGVPLNVMAGRGGGPSTAELQALGVARVSVGPALTLAVMAQVRRAAAELLEQGTYEAMQGGMAFPEANSLFARAGREA
ncbi:isocitrate lyase/phosphoenolpyruvate mutase family protein [Longimicrobium sp.]|uniref:isocitrate lyase/PEP mutase family protein n=1 Tax=Longimicrobium sp. TaxID=2029185 RepID=UPI002E36F7E8|nr:isocitrate lyase/phosphoenolpyruvate mutase family protein [Longimicrobium sp.]HEX6040504.1 isocitrate lyase/phosphoenolpyruvate mutase family protein [Longimicrobium sp.]